MNICKTNLNERNLPHKNCTIHPIQYYNKICYFYNNSNFIVSGKLFIQSVIFIRVSLNIFYKHSIQSTHFLHPKLHDYSNSHTHTPPNPIFEISATSANSYYTTNRHLVPRTVIVAVIRQHIAARLR